MIKVYYFRHSRKNRNRISTDHSNTSFPCFSDALPVYINKIRAEFLPVLAEVL